ncbi:MAG: glycosyltransferase [Verrucomicrobiota bacterium]|nr:glycosyltransferase [Verrucomicrobiota bacterium]
MISSNVYSGISNFPDLTKDAVGLVVDRKFYVELGSLTPDQLTSLYKDLIKDEATYGEILFDIEDQILRRIDQDPSAQITYTSQLPASCNLIKKIERFCQKGSRFNLRTESNNGKVLPVRVLKLSTENSRNHVGGIGSVMSGLRQAHKELNLEKIDSMHIIFSKDKSSVRNECEFIGTFQHKYDHEEVKSSVYRDKKNREYLIQVDPKSSFVSKVTSGNGIFENNDYSTSLSRVLYQSSAAGGFSASFSGKSGEKKVDIVQTEGLLLGGVTFSLLKGQKAIAVKHDCCYNDPVYVQKNTLQGLGVDVANINRDQVDLCENAIQTADKVCLVSTALALETWNSNSDLVLKQGQLTAIRNGIDADSFDITNCNVFKDFALQKTFDENGVETTDYVKYKSDIKKKLYDAGYIADENLSLIVFVGRYAHEKGVDILTKTILNNPSKMQFVTMGIRCGNNETMNSFITQLQDAEKQGTHKLRCYTNKEQQTEEFQGVAVGKLLRAAADFSFVPSHSEGCGLVAAEGQCSGAIVIAPYHQGLKELCRPYGPDDYSFTNSADRVCANAVCYMDHNSSEQAISAVQQAVALWTAMSIEEKKLVSRQIHNYAIPNYSWYYQDPSKKLVTGAVVSYHRMYESLARPGEIVTETKAGRLVAPQQGIQNSQGTVTIHDILKRKEEKSDKSYFKKYFVDWNRIKYPLGDTLLSRIFCAVCECLKNISKLFYNYLISIPNSVYVLWLSAQQSKSGPVAVTKDISTQTGD